VLFQYRPWGAVAGVDLLGEVESWHAPIPMADVGSGLREASVLLGPGVYAYKFRHSDESYHLDPNNPRTVSRDGHRNSVAVVDGTPEPLLHAPHAPFLWRRDDGRICLRAALRKGHGETLRVRFDEGHGSSLCAMAQVGAEDEHLLFEVHLAASSERLRYAFVLADDRTVGREGALASLFDVSLSDFPRALPTWWQRGVMYTVFVDRFRRGDGSPWPSLACERDRAGGDLYGVIEALPHLSALGVDILHLTPLALSPSAHRYDAIDCRVVDPALGGEQALTLLLAAAHARGMRVILDVAVTHVHREHARFRDVRERGMSSPYWDWFYAYRHPFDEGPDGGYVHYPKGQWHEPLLRTTHPDVVEDVVGHFEHFARLGVDGFRIDAACSLPVGLSRRIRRAVQQIKRDAVVWGEVIVDNGERWIAHNALDSVTDFVAQHDERRFLAGEIDAPELSQRLSHRAFRRAGEGARSIAFTANHDQARLLSLHGDADLARAAHVLLLTRAAMPALYYGDELGLSSTKSSRNFEDAWPDRAPLDWDQNKWDHATLDLTKKLTALRRAHPALHAGDERWLSPERESGEPALDVVGLRRETGSEIIDVLLHRGAESVRVRLPDGAPSCADILVASGDVELFDGGIALGPRSAVVLLRTPSSEVRDLYGRALSESETVAQRAFASGAVEIAGLPPRLYLTVTERCNLRCVHCITHAPRLTSEGRARTMSPWVVDRLADSFRAASYIGFVHGGESLVAPEFFDILRSIQHARKTATGKLDLHLLSNGMLLDETRVNALIDHGVTSIAVSLDGASAGTNDRLRVQGKFERVVHNVARVVELRARRNVDLRIGISSVVSRSSIPELSALGRLCKQLGVDWLKVEEMYGATQAAIAEEVPSGAPHLASAMAGLRTELAGSSLTLVDHLEDHAGCACTGERAREFRAADDFANRARFRPCRMLWEQAAIDPDGQVRPIDYGYAAVGSLLDASFLELWNSEPLRLARARVLTRSAPSARQRCLRS